MQRPKPRSSSSSAAAFTLVESMVVVTIVGLMAAAIMPSMSEMMADGRQSSSGNALVRLLRGTRDAALETRFAHRLVFDPSGSGNLGTIVVQAAMGSSCLRTPSWVNALGQLDMGEYNSGSVRIELDANVPVGTVDTDVTNTATICFQPNGEIWTVHGTGTPLTRLQSTILFTIRRSIGGGTTRGVDRQIALAPGGTARLR